MKKSRHVVISPGGGWAVRQTGASRASKTFPTQDAAIAYGRGLAKKESGELYVHRADGTVRKKDSYASDPLSPRG